MKTVATKKTAKITVIMAISIECSECGEWCEDHYGSSMITNESETVQCRYCGTVYALPANAWSVMTRAVCKEVVTKEE